GSRLQATILGSRCHLAARDLHPCLWIFALGQIDFDGFAVQAPRRRSPSDRLDALFSSAVEIHCVSAAAICWLYRAWSVAAGATAVEACTHRSGERQSARASHSGGAGFGDWGAGGAVPSCQA